MLGAIAADCLRSRGAGFELHRNLGHVDYSAEVAELVNSAYEDGWVRRELYWGERKAADEARTLRDDPTVMEQATTRQLGNVLTVVIRQERFVDGSLLSAIESGLVQRILRRVRSLDQLAASADG
ncbi:MAG: DUF6508 domain-containing protein [Trueperaceae bacterium]|mgnify:CR=1 FL=1|nr:DUF6508 domain-containing protein [Trueperaceae bacterium]